MTISGVNGDWSIKDILAHLAAWHRYLLIHLHAAARDEVPATQGAFNEEDIDRTNERLYQENTSRPLSEVLTDFHTTYKGITEAVQALNDEDLFNPQRFTWMSGNTLLELVAGNTYEHYDEHMPPIEAWLARSKES